MFLLYLRIAEVAIPGPAPKTPAEHFRAGKKGVRLSVFEACAMQIKTIYEKAILRYPNHTTQDRVSDLLQPVIQKLEQRLSYQGQTRLITADECAGVARSAWLFWFTIIVSKKEERKKHIGFNAL